MKTKHRAAATDDADPKCLASLMLNRLFTIPRSAEEMALRDGDGCKCSGKEKIS